MQNRRRHGSGMRGAERANPAAAALVGGACEIILYSNMPRSDLSGARVAEHRTSVGGQGDWCRWYACFRDIFRRGANDQLQGKERPRDYALVRRRSKAKTDVYPVLHRVVHPIFQQHIGLNSWIPLAKFFN